MENSGSISYRLRKPCRLRHKALVDGLFSGGESAYSYPLRVVWRSVDATTLQASFMEGAPPRPAKVQMLVSVPKRKLRRAVDRVLMRRRIREAYRHLLPEFEEQLAASHLEITTLSVGIIYIANRTEPFALVQRKLTSLLEKISDNLAAEKK